MGKSALKNGKILQSRNGWHLCYTSVFLKVTNEFNQFTSILIVDHRYL